MEYFLKKYSIHKLLSSLTSKAELSILQVQFLTFQAQLLICGVQRAEWSRAEHLSRLLYAWLAKVYCSVEALLEQHSTWNSLEQRSIWNLIEQRSFWNLIEQRSIWNSIELCPYLCCLSALLFQTDVRTFYQTVSCCQKLSFTCRLCILLYLQTKNILFHVILSFAVLPSIGIKLFRHFERFGAGVWNVLHPQVP